jgi:hypothetical protein
MSSLLVELFRTVPEAGGLCIPRGGLIALGQTCRALRHAVYAAAAERRQHVDLVVRESLVGNAGTGCRTKAGHRGQLCVLSNNAVLSKDGVWCELCTVEPLLLRLCCGVSVGLVIGRGVPTWLQAGVLCATVAFKRTAAGSCLRIDRWSFDWRDFDVEEPLRAPHFSPDAWLTLDGGVLESFLSSGGECVCFRGFSTARGQRNFFEVLERSGQGSRLRSLVFDGLRRASTVPAGDDDVVRGLLALSRVAAQAGAGLERLCLEEIKFVPQEQAWLRDVLVGASGLHTLRLVGFRHADLGDEAFDAFVRLVPRLRVLSVPQLGWTRTAPRAEVLPPLFGDVLF